jgi:hypothetical protein
VAQEGGTRDRARHDGRGSCTITDRDRGIPTRQSTRGFLQLFQLSAPAQRPVIMSLLTLVLLLAGLAWQAIPEARSVAWIMIPLSFAISLASATSRRSIDYFGALPLRRRRVFAGTAAPWLAAAAFLPTIVFLREVAGGAPSHVRSAWMALMAACLVFGVGAEAPSAGPRSRRWLGVLASCSPPVLIVALMWSLGLFRYVPGARFPLVGALAVVLGVFWYVRQPWRRLRLPP